jgi:hypothetical protein
MVCRLTVPYYVAFLTTIITYVFRMGTIFNSMVLTVTGREADMDRNNKSPEICEITNDDNTTTNCVFSNESHPVMATQSVILGASNCTRLVFENPNVHNISVSGTTLDQVQKL